MVMRAMFGAAVIVFIMGYSVSPMMLFIMRLVQGAVTGTVSASNALVSSVSPRSRAAFSMGIMQTSVYLGSSTGPLLGGFVADTFGYRASFTVAAGLMLIGGIIVLLVTDEGNAAPQKADASGRAPAKSDSLRSLLLNGSFFALLTTLFMTHFSNTVLGPIFPLFVRSRMTDPAMVNTVVGSLMAVSSIVAALMSIPIGWVSDKVGPKKTLAAGMALGGIVFSLYPFMPTIGALFVIRAFTGLAASCVGPTLGGIISRSVPRSSQGKAFGMVQSANSLGFGAGPAAGSLIAIGYGIEAPFFVTGVIQIFLAFLSWKLIKDSPIEAREPKEAPVEVCVPAHQPIERTCAASEPTKPNPSPWDSD
jgi:DHA1 family multidrug resistance protein-like MFS transporter